MYDSSSSASDTLQSSAIRLGGRHGYRIDGDVASINAELSFVSGAPAAQHWALQLWACEEPYGGGTLSGFKVAEAPIALPAGDQAELPQLDAVTFAHPPASSRDYSMVLVLAAGHPGAFDQVHDFANYPARERFVAPHFEGSVGYKLVGDGKVALRAERVINPRALNNLSGSLALQLWQLAEPYRGGSFEGTLLATAALGRVHGQSAIEADEQEVALAHASAGRSHVVLMLREWTAAGYLTRDYCNFAEPYAVGEPLALAQPEAFVQPELAAVSEVAAVPVQEMVAVPETVAAPETVVMTEAVAVAEAVAVMEALAEPVTEARATPMAEALAEPVTEARATPMAEALAEPVTEARATPMAEAVAEPVTEARATPMAEAVAEPVTEARATPMAAAAGEAVVAQPETVVQRETAARPILAVVAPAAQLDETRLSLHRASADELVRATGISKKMAAEVIKARPFRSFDELVRVRGIGERTVRKFRDTMKL